MFKLTKTSCAVLAVLAFAGCDSAARKVGRGSANKSSDLSGNNVKVDTENASKTIALGVVRTSRSKPRLGDRFYIASVLHTTFGPKADPTIGELILLNVGTFGGACDAFSLAKGCPGDLSLTQTSLIPTSLSTREGYLTRACQSITLDDAAIVYAVETNLKKKVATVPTEADIKEAYDMFYPGREPTAPVAEALKAVVDEAGNVGMESKDAWRSLLVGLCLSPGWQVL